MPAVYSDNAYFSFMANIRSVLTNCLQPECPCLTAGAIACIKHEEDCFSFRFVRDTPLKGDKPWELLTFCVETEEGAEATSKRLDHMYKPMLRKRPDGSDLTWKVATMSRFEEPDRSPKPFFISWDDPTKRPDKVSRCSSPPLLQLCTSACRRTAHTLSLRFPTACRLTEADVSMGSAHCRHQSCMAIS